MRPTQYFTKEYLEYCRNLSPTQIAEFLESFRLMNTSIPSKESSKLISIRVPENLLKGFKDRCRKEGVPYQTRIKQLMRLIV